MVDKDLESTLQDKKNIIDLHEKELSKEEIERDYVDIKQAAQIMNNVSARTAYRYIDKVSESHNINIRFIELTVNQGVKKLYLKEDVLKIAKILNKDKTVIVYEQVDVNDNDVNDITRNESLSATLPNSGKELSKSVKESTAVVNAEILSKFITTLDHLNVGLQNVSKVGDILEKLEKKADTVVDSLMKQGVEFQNNFFKAKADEFKMEIERIDIERKKLESDQKSRESMQSLAAAVLTKKNPSWVIPAVVTANVAVLVLILIGIKFYLGQMDSKWEKKLSENLTAEQAKNEKLINVLTDLQKGVTGSEHKPGQESRDAAGGNR